METIEQGMVYGRVTDFRPLNQSWGTQAFGPGLLSWSSSVIGSGVCEYVYGQMMVSLELGCMC